MASIPSLQISLELRSLFADKSISGLPVEVEWNEGFQKYQVIRVLPQETPITTEFFFYHVRS